MDKNNYINLLIQEVDRLRNQVKKMTSEDMEARMEQLEACLLELEPRV